MDYKLLKITQSNKKGKKLMAIFENKKNGRTKTTHFGQAGAKDYTIYYREEGKKKANERKSLYYARHRKRENWDDFLSAGSLSKFILWNLPTRQASIKYFKTKFKL